MFIKKEIALREFKPWAGAVNVFKRLTTEELNTLDDLFSEVGEYTETEINDELWFNTDWILETLQINEDEFWKREV